MPLESERRLAWEMCLATSAELLRVRHGGIWTVYDLWGLTKAGKD